MTTANTSERPGAADEAVRRRPVLSVVVPVYNGGEEIVDNVRVIRRRAAAGLRDEDVELVVVSDGSIDGTAERLLAARDQHLRVIHYDRNLGKGYAVKAGALSARGEWIGFVDADLDLDPAAIPGYLAVAQDERLDLVVGSKRHPESVVSYPRSRRIASWCYQQLNRVLFRLNVRDTQVGLKVLRRQVAEDVLPLLLVKRFAFDLELLAVAHELGYRNVRELPIRLEYRFTGSGVRSRAVLRALLDTAAVFYRLRILRTYQRKRRLVRNAVDYHPCVSIVGADAAVVEQQDYQFLESRPTAADADGELLALPASGARPAGNWVAACVPFFAYEGVSAVVCPTMAPACGRLRDRLAEAVLESRLGGGSRRMHSVPGNLRLVTDHPAESVVLRRRDWVSAERAGVQRRSLVAWLDDRGLRTVYTPETVVVQAPPPALRPLLRSAAVDGVARGKAARRTRGRSASGATVVALAPTAAGLAGVPLLVAGGAGRPLGVALVSVFALSFGVAGALAGVRSRSVAVAALVSPTLLAGQASYVAGFVRGLAGGSTSSSRRTAGSRTAQSKRRE
jgi:glycosyltransferase involved in cell wall biosynthesis